MTEQRQADRLTLEETSVEVIDVESGVEFMGSATDVSGQGLSFTSSMEPPLGADMKVTLKGQKNLSAQMQVTRVKAANQGFEVAGTLSRVR